MLPLSRQSPRATDRLPLATAIASDIVMAPVTSPVGPTPPRPTPTAASNFSRTSRWSAVKSTVGPGGGTVTNRTWSFGARVSRKSEAARMTRRPSPKEMLSRSTASTMRRPRSPAALAV